MALTSLSSESSVHKIRSAGDLGDATRQTATRESAASYPSDASAASVPVYEESTAGADSGVPDGDLAWMFGTEDVPTPPAVDDVLGRALDDLLGDWKRKGGQLTRAEVAVIAAKRQMTPTQHGELIKLLEEAGVDLPHVSAIRPRRSAPEGYELDGDAVGQYLRTLSRYPLIDAAREVELWALISQGAAARQRLAARSEELSAGLRQILHEQVRAGRRAHHELVCANLRLVVSIARARQYEVSGVDFADRIQDGNLGLMRAADKFDGSKGYKFSTYATWWIRQSIERGIVNRGRTIRLPAHLHEQILKVKKALARLTAMHDHPPTLAEITEATGLEAGRVQYLLDVMQPTRSLDELLGEDGDLRLSDILADEGDHDGRTDPASVVAHAMFRTDLNRTLRIVLTEREVRVLERRFGVGTDEQETLDTIAVDCGLTRERIRQIQSKALAKLRDRTEVSALRSYLIDDSKTV